MVRLVQMCEQRGLRLTEPRRTVLDVLETATDHPCAYEIHRRASQVSNVGLPTVYRVLGDLVKAGLLTRHVFGDRKARYERVGSEPHPYLIDIASGQIVGVDDDGLARLLEETARRLGYRLVDCRLTLFGEKK